MTKAAVVTDEKEDYHFYRQYSNGYWSHKPGSTDVTNKDATGRFIYDPQLASRKYHKSSLNYRNFCGFFCFNTASFSANDLPILPGNIINNVGMVTGNNKL
jgi:hypothetical protein